MKRSKTQKKKKAAATPAPLGPPTPPPPMAMAKIDYERLRQVSGVVQLQEVLLVKADWQSNAPSAREDIGTGAMRYALTLTAVSWSSAPKRLTVYLDYRLVAFAELTPGKPTNLFGLSCRWAVLFGVPEDFAAPAVDVMTDFAAANGQLNAFPYIRQFVQEATGRGGWPPLVLPTFRIPADRPKELAVPAPA